MLHAERGFVENAMVSLRSMRPERPVCSARDQLPVPPAEEVPDRFNNVHFSANIFLIFLFPAFPSTFVSLFHPPFPAACEPFP